MHLSLGVLVRMPRWSNSCHHAQIARMNKSVIHTKLQERIRCNKAMTITMMDEEIDRSNSDSVSSVEVGFRLIDELDNEWECRCDSYEERQNWERLLSHTISHSTLPFLA